MNPTGKKFISLFLMFSLMMLSINLYAKERRGVKLSVWKIGGQKIGGELITVKEDSLLLLESESGADVSVNIKDIIEIRYVEKAAVKKGYKTGLFFGIICGLPAVLIAGGLKSFVPILFHLSITGIATLIGGSMGYAAGTRRYVFTAMTDLEIQEALDYLRKKARIRDYK